MTGLMDPNVFQEGIPYEYFRELRATRGLTRATDVEGQEFWNVVRHPEVAAISRDPKVFSSSPSTMTSVRLQESEYPIITFLDPPDHTRMRRLTFKAFAPARMAALAGPIRRIAGSLLATAAAKGEFDLADDVALLLPFEVLAELLGVPGSDRRMVIGWARQTVNLGDPEYDPSVTDAGTDVFRQILDYFMQFARYRAGTPADDLFSVLSAARVKGDRLSPEEIAVFATTLITAGSETTYCSVTGAVLALLEHPDQLAMLRADRSLIPGAVAEMLRWITPVTHFARNVVAGTEIAGQPIVAGERVVMWYTSANRDEAVFADPDRFDITRSPNPHLTFGGGGPHVCIGNGLAVLELRMFLEAALDLIPRIEFAGPLVRPETNFMNSIKHMPVRLTTGSA
ncbi:cholest-4-en-3-one 26-monooxygenase [Kibdelosporangium banguiense]|uniref:Cholest-4-en-3-one 26-monooxygenase n=1 Tax=Kibdelosporangium banguiense TaxID=1365924 RepID=A0ABS4TTE8_9PSEU|nr:cytochrome P450 [Kibdelosporangium banguiense]MBP2327279.1 cholest-4-en-3-one 26-monooxygenase [Kibdelosporangium banguiense]